MKTEINTTRLYSIKEVEIMWGISRWKIYELIKEGQIRPIVGMGKGFKFDGHEISKVRMERL